MPPSVRNRPPDSCGSRLRYLLVVGIAAAPGHVDLAARLSAERRERSRPRFDAPAAAVVRSIEKRAACNGDSDKAAATAVRPTDRDGVHRWRSADRSPPVSAPPEHERAAETAPDQAAAEARCTGYGDRVPRREATSFRVRGPRSSRAPLSLRPRSFRRTSPRAAILRAAPRSCSPTPGGRRTDRGSNRRYTAPIQRSPSRKRIRRW